MVFGDFVLGILVDQVWEECDGNELVWCCGFGVLGLGSFVGVQGSQYVECEVVLIEYESGICGERFSCGWV